MPKDKPKVGLYTPFPELERRAYFSLVSLAQSIDGSYVCKNNLGLPLGYESYDSRHDISGVRAQIHHAEFKEYQEHIDQLETFKKVHAQEFRERFEKKNQEVDVKELEYPKNERQKSSLLSDYTAEDMLFINAHGNPYVVGAGSLVLTPPLLAENLTQLGLSKINPPTVVIWSCNSGVKAAKENISYAGALQKALQDKGYQHMDVIGIAAKIYVEQGTRDVVTHVREKQKRKREFPESEVLDFHTTPGAAAELNAAPEDEGLMTIAQRVKLARLAQQAARYAIARDESVQEDVTTGPNVPSPGSSSVTPSDPPSSPTSLPMNTNREPLVERRGALASTTQSGSSEPRRSTRLRQPPNPSGSSNG